MAYRGEDELLSQKLLQEKGRAVVQRNDQANIFPRFWTESRKLWQITAPSIFSRVAAATMNIVTQAFAGHLGEVELASISIANTVIVGFNFGLLVSTSKYIANFRVTDK